MIKELIESEPLVEEITPFPSAIDLFNCLHSEPHSFFLDSGMDPCRLGRYSFMGYDPFLIFRSKGREVELIEGSGVRRVRRNPFYVLKDLDRRYRLCGADGLPPMVGGAVGYFGYDLKSAVEKVPSISIDDLKVPDCYLCFYDRVIALDHLKRRAFAVSSGFPERDKRRREERARRRLDELLDKVGGAGETSRSSVSQEEFDIESNFEKDAYLGAVKRAKEYIAAGDIYQVNLAQRFSCDLAISPYELYQRLRRINPSPFGGYLNFDGLTVLSSSPERFLRISGCEVETRPIKGTRPRGRNFIEDRKLGAELLQSGKDRAELVMIVDLERNDLGRVCEYGSVEVTEPVVLEKYPTVFHLVATVEGRLHTKMDRVDCLKACFPGGSITGAPKIRAMEIIEEIEPTKRGIYTGSIGYLGFNGEADLNIVIRTMVACNGKVYFHAGGGIVTDSDPEKEYQETLDKAKALMEAIRRAHRI